MSLAQEIDEARAFIARLKDDIGEVSSVVIGKNRDVERAQAEFREAQAQLATLRSMLHVQKEKLAGLSERYFDEERQK